MTQQTIPVEELANRCEFRMRHLARRMLRQYPIVRRWEDTDDILQEAALRLHRALHEVVPDSELHLHRLASLQVRRVLIDLSRKYSRLNSFAANHDTGHDGVPLYNAPDRVDGNVNPSETFDRWTEFHLLVAGMPHELRDVVDLLWYEDLGQETAAKLLDITVRTLQRRWREARLQLMRALAEDRHCGPYRTHS